MARTTLSLSKLRHRPKKPKQQTANLDDLGGYSALDLFQAFCETAHVSHFIDYRKSSYLTIESVTRRGRMVMAEIESGFFGNPGAVRELKNNTVAFKKSSDQVSTTPTRVALVLPPDAMAGYFFVEREGGLGAGSTVLQCFREALANTFVDSFFPAERIFHKEAWIESAELSRVEVRYKNWKPSLSGANLPDGMPAMAEQRREVRPPKGSGVFGRPFKRSALEREISLTRLVGFDENDAADIEEIVELQLGDKTKSFSLGNDRTPPVTVVLTDSDQPRLEDTPFMERVFREADELYEAEEQSWEHDWEHSEEEEPDDVKWPHIYAGPKPGTPFHPDHPEYDPEPAE